jgi:hypothetical protein
LECELKGCRGRNQSKLTQGAVFEPPCYERPKTQYKLSKKSREKKNERKKIQICFMSPGACSRVFFVKKNVFVVLNSSCYETPKKLDKNQGKVQKNKIK